MMVSDSVHLLREPVGIGARINIRSSIRPSSEMGPAPALDPAIPGPSGVATGSYCCSVYEMK